MLDCLLDYFQDSYGRSNKQVWVGGRDWNLVAWTLYYRPRSVNADPLGNPVLSFFWMGGGQGLSQRV